MEIWTTKSLIHGSVGMPGAITVIAGETADAAGKAVMRVMI